MAKAEMKIVWSNPASKHFQEILEYLAFHSEPAVNIVGNAILDEIELIAKSPVHNPKDRFKKNNNGSYRACVVFSYRISYLIEKNQVKILRIRHTSREPLEF